MGSMSTRHPTTRRRGWTLLALLLTLAVFATACGGDDDADDSDRSADDAADEASATDDAASDSDGDAGDPSDGDGSDDSDDDAAASDGDETSGDGDGGATSGGDDRSLDDVQIPTGVEGFCGDFWDYLQNTIDLMNVLFDGEPAEIEAAAGPMRESIVAIQASVPGDHADQMTLANEPVLMMLEALESYDWDFRAAMADPATQMPKSPETEAAEEAVYQLAVDECGYDPEAMGLSPPT